MSIAFYMSVFQLYLSCVYLSAYKRKLSFFEVLSRQLLGLGRWEKQTAVACLFAIVPF